MPNSIQKITIYSLFVLLSLSCRKELPFKSTAQQSRIVVNSLFATDSTLRVHVSRSSSVMDTANHKVITDAMVEIYNAENTLITTLDYTKEGVYNNVSFYPSQNEVYHLKISADGFESVSSSESIPQPVVIVGVDTVSTTNKEGEPILEVSVHFKDPGNIRNFYLIEMVVIGMMPIDIGGDSLNFRQQERMSSNDPNIETVNQFIFNGYSNASDYLILSDKNFDGTTYTLNFSIINWHQWSDSQMTGQIRLLSTSEAYFNYRKSYEEYVNTQGNPFANPVQVYSNIENGIGIFAGGTLTTWDINFK